MLLFSTLILILHSEYMAFIKLSILKDNDYSEEADDEDDNDNDDDTSDNSDSDDSNDNNVLAATSMLICSGAALWS